MRSLLLQLKKKLKYTFYPYVSSKQLFMYLYSHSNIKLRLHSCVEKNIDAKEHMRCSLI